MNHDDLLRDRLARQRLTGPPATSPEALVRDLLAVQAQDAVMAQAMVALRSTGRASDVRAAVDAGTVVRTHVLRPTWHYVAADDLVWLLALTAPKIERSLTARHRQLGLVDPVVRDRALDVVAASVAGHEATREQVGEALVADGVLSRDDPLFGQQVGHVLMIAELRALVCSGPPRQGKHTYALVSERIPPAPVRERQDAVVELTRRFVVSHGPVALEDLRRWTMVTLTEARTACQALEGLVEPVDVEGHQLWQACGRPVETRPVPALVLSVFDEAYLTYRVLGFPRSDGHPWGPTEVRFAQSASGPVLHEGRDVGVARRRATQFDLELDPSLGRRARDAVDQAAARVIEVLAT